MILTIWPTFFFRIEGLEKLQEEGILIFRTWTVDTFLSFVLEFLIHL